MIFASVFVLASALVASALTRFVIVGAQTDLVFSPTSVAAQLGDTISFQFQSGNHSVTQSTFAAPCTRMTQGVDSGFQAVAGGSTDIPSWSITIYDLAPFWFYCAQETPTNHCQAGMVFAINPTSDMTFDAFQAAAKASKGTASVPPASATDGGGSSTSTLASGSPVATDAGADTTSGIAGSPMSAPNGAIVSCRLGSAGAVGFVSMVAVVAGLML